MRMLTDLFDRTIHQETLLVLLPPAESKIEDFIAQGFIAAVRSRKIQVDIVLAEVTYMHVMSKTTISALHKYVIQPALVSGYKKVWFAGISLGAFNALYYASEYSEHLSGIYLIAPYPGTNDILNEITEAGGALKWTSSNSANQKDERAWWHWIARESVKGKLITQIYLGTGDDDRFLRGQRMLSGLLPNKNVLAISGTHSWPAWIELWHNWLELALLPRSAGASCQ